MKRLAGVALLAASLATAQSTPSSEVWTGTFDLRNRFVAEPAGSSNVYRSVVNLGEGLRLYDANLLYRSPTLTARCSSVRANATSTIFDWDTVR